MAAALLPSAIVTTLAVVTVHATHPTAAAAHRDRGVAGVRCDDAVVEAASSMGGEGG